MIIPTFNRSAMLLRALDSVFRQTHPVDEIIIVDDGSTDDTADAVRRLEDPRIVYVWQPNAGVSAARNHGLSLARGRYLALLDSDDVWLPDKTRRQMAMLQQHPDYGMVLCDVTRVDKDGATIDVFQRREIIREDGWVLKWIIHNPALAPASALLRREVYDDIGGFDESLRTAEDLEFHLRVAARWQVGVVEEALVRALRGHDGLSSEPGTYEDYVRVVEQAIARYGDILFPAERRRALAATYARNARGMAIVGRWRQAVALLRKAVSHADDAHARRAVAATAGFMARRAVTRIWR